MKNKIQIQYLNYCCLGLKTELVILFQALIPFIFSQMAGMSTLVGLFKAIPSLFSYYYKSSNQQW